MVGGVYELAMSETHREGWAYHVMQYHQRCSAYAASFRSAYKKDISELRQMDHVSSKRCHAQIKGIYGTV
jgi:hypothetical protein